ncbi:MAG: glycosyltransferase [Butyrivibrio sp.]|uniref:glycosyltransferase n=1 Tax=Butyrivibrio sp. TaxID=28121 RepID=UPI001B1E0558|nr:glycosyltransferase [Butyrivibrio sp.]MBO6241712.1 glycosyltransferase [Butyrivibrio sp.]
MIYEGVKWADECMEYSFIFPSREDHELHDFISEYTNYIKHHGAPDLVLATAWPMMSYVAKRTSQELNKNFIVASWLHAPLSMYEASNFGGGDYVKYADLHFAISNEIAGAIRNADPDGIIYRVNNPVDLSKIHPIERRNKGTLLFVGRLSEEKNIGIIIGAIALARTEWKLDIIGDGDEKEKLINLANEFDVANRISFMGWTDDPWKYAEGTTALVLSSMFEGSPLVAIEALSCGLPIIANHSSRVGEVIIQNETGCLYEDNDIEGLACILDDIANERITFASEKKCRESVFDYKDEIALFDFYAKIYAAVNGRRVVSHELGALKPIIKDRISVIVPCYNVEKYIGRCLDSIINQTVGLERLEIIAVNDCSTDHTIDILEKYEKKYPDRLCMVNCSENGGLSRARNIGLTYATGDYISFVDSDDYIRADMLEKLLLNALCYKTDVVSCDFDIFDDKLPTKQDEAYVEGYYTVVESEFDRRQLLADNLFFNSAWAKLFNRDFLKGDIDLLFPEGYRMEDILFTYTVVAKADFWLHIKYNGYLYYQNSEGIMKSSAIKDYYMDVFKVFAMAVDKYKELNLFNALYRELEYAYYIKVFKNIILYVSAEFKELPMDNIELLVNYMKDNFSDYNRNEYLSESEKEDIADWCEIIK